MTPSLERFHELLRKEPFDINEGTYFQSTSRVIDSKTNAQINFVSVLEGDKGGLPEGLYIRSNFPLAFYEALPHLKDTIYEEVSQMFQLEDALSEFDGEQWIDILKIIGVNIYALEPNETIIFALKPILPSQLINWLQGAL